MAEFHSFAGFDGLAGFAAASVAAHLRQGLASRGKASLVVPGGRTPGPFFSALAGHHLDWQHVSVTLSDERWVDETSPLSNGALLRRTFLTGNAASAHFVPLYTGGESPEAGLAAAAENVAAMPLPFDAVVLGMGDDGHFASLFPDEAVLEAGLDPDSEILCVPASGPAGGPPRLSLTLSCLIRARHIYVLATGAKKRDVWEKAQRLGVPAAALQELATPPVDFLWCEG